MIATLPAAAGLARPAGPPAAPPAAPDGPAFAARPERLAMLRRRRATRALAEQVYSGRWREALLEAQRTQHRYRETKTADGRIGELVEKINYVKRAMDMHADIIAAQPPRISVPDGFEMQRAAIDAARRRSLFDALFHESALAACVAGECFLRADMDDSGAAVVCIDDPESTFPVGEPGPDGQPRVFERRWFITRAMRGERHSRRWLRIERHRAEGGVGVIEQESYRAVTADILVDLTDRSKVRRVPLAEALGEGAPLPAERIETGAPAPAIVQLVAWRRGGEPRLRINEHSLDLVDASAAHLSRLSRQMELHASAKLRVSEEMIDPATGRMKDDIEAIIDPEKMVEYIQAQAAWEAMIAFLDKLSFALMVEMEASPALLGMRAEGMGSVTSAAQLRIESTGALAAARRAAPHMNSALERLFDTLSMIDSAAPLRGYPVAPVGVEIHPDLPLSLIDRAREQAVLVQSGLTSRRRAVAALHGDDEAEAIIGEIEADERSRSQRLRDSALGAFGGEL